MERKRERGEGRFPTVKGNPKDRERERVRQAVIFNRRRGRGREGRFRVADSDSDYEFVNLLEFPAVKFVDVSSTLAFRQTESVYNFILYRVVVVTRDCQNS